MRKNDLIVACLLVLCAALLFVWQSAFSEQTAYRMIIQHDQTVLHAIHQAELADKHHLQITVPTEHGSVLVDLDAKQGMAIIKSPCPDQLCVRQPRITRVGQSILCLPEKILVEIVSDRKEGAPDAILR